MIEVPVVTGNIGDLGFLYDRRSRPHPILKRTNSLVFTDDPVSRAIALKFNQGAAGLRLRPFRIRRLERWGFDAMTERVPYDAQTSFAASRLAHSFLASLDDNDVPRHTVPAKPTTVANHKAARAKASALRALGLSPATALTRGKIP